MPTIARRGSTNTLGIPNVGTRGIVAVVSASVKLEAVADPPPLLHPEMAGIYRAKVTELARALQDPDSRSEATEALRGLVDAIVLTPAARTAASSASSCGATWPRC